MRKREWQVIVQHSFRESNRVADLLANLGHSFRLGVHQIIDFPPNIRRAILTNCIWVSFPRLIPINS
ncbi:hypothetical protein LINPERHAP2_LOCUS4880 [Linum perenne]